MASQAAHLTHKEIGIFRQNEMEDDIPSIERRIGHRLNHRGAKWTTLGSKPDQCLRQEKTRPGPDTEAKAGPITTESAMKNYFKIVLLGPEGAGKSALGNLLAGNNKFKVAATCGTEQCEGDVVMYDYKEWQIVDTPGKPFSKLTPPKSASKRKSKNANEEIHDNIEVIKAQLKQADVIMFVLNTSHKRTPDMGINTFRQIFPEDLNKTGMLVTTHGECHYRMKGTSELLDDLNESPDISRFLDCITDRVVIVELGDAHQTEDALLDGNAVYDKERDQAREMVMAMAKHIVQNNAKDPEQQRQNLDPMGGNDRPLPVGEQASKFV